MSNLDAARSGDRRQALVALRDTLARELDAVKTTMGVSQLSAQYRACLAELASIPDAEVVSKHDELRNRREKRRAAATTVAVTGKKGGKRGA